MRSLVLPLGLSRLSRNPARPNQIVLLIGAAFGLMLFMTTYDNSLTLNQRELAHYQTGADFRIARENQSVDELINIPGILQASQVLRLRLSTNTGSSLTLLALDSQTFAHVAYYPVGMTNISMEAIAQTLRWDATQQQSGSGNDSTPNPFLDNPDPAQAIPAIYSQAALPTNKGIGDTLQIQVQGIPVDLNVRGIIVNFPTLTRSFILVDISALQSFLDLQASSYHNNQEIWLATDPAQHDALVTILSQNSTILADSQAELLRIQNNAFTEGARRAFTLNAYTLAVLSIVGFILLNYFSAQQRLYEFGILRANGMSIGQVITLLISEGMLIMILGLAVGSGIGFGLIQSMRVFLNSALAKTFPAAVVNQIVIDWPRVGSITGILVVAYLLATLVFLLILVKSGVHRVIRIGEE
jgi:ABC-type antimicrobial peptide transport system permease subunit